MFFFLFTGKFLSRTEVNLNNSLKMTSDCILNSEMLPPFIVSSSLHCTPDKVSVPPASLLASPLPSTIPPSLPPSPPQPPGEERYCWCITNQDNLFKWQIRRVTRFVSDTVCSVCYQSNKANLPAPRCSFLSAPPLMHTPPLPAPPSCICPHKLPGPMRTKRGLSLGA